MAKFNDNLVVVQSMAYVQDAMDKLDEEAGQLEAQIAKRQAALDVNREQKRRLEHGYAAMRHNETK